ncbi:MAG TPA: DUF72 domain-containing protein [Bacteroidota bacterium]|nr:DUF72 domain-containing protein [Bacteroidota bacterium]
MPRKRQSPDTLPLFDDAPESAARTPPESPYVTRNRDRLHRWASKGIYFGSSSWKYPGWQGLVYNRAYPSKKAFERECLTEYSDLFPTVCADFALYDFPDSHQMRIIHESTADDFKLSLKVTDRITVKRYPNLPRHGANAGRENPDFLNLELFEDAFLRPVETLRKKRGVIIFEFSAFYPNSGVTYEKFLRLMDDFLARLPKEFSYAVEIRNKEYLTSDYLTMLADRGVAHVLNSWTKMPPIIEQIQLGGVLSAKFSVARALLRPGRTYQEAVEMFQPYDAIKEENPEIRLGLAESARRCIAEGKHLYAYVNNRAEGNSPKTIEAILDILDTYPVETL